MADIILLSAIFFLEILLFYFLPVFNGKGTLFGFVVYESDSATGVLRRYRLGLIIIALIFLSAIIGGVFYLPQSLVFIYIFSVLALGWWLHTNFLRSWKMRKVEVFTRFAASLKPRRLSNFTNVWWELLVVLLALAPVGVLIYFYPQLPATIPVHWGAGGQPDRWAAKGMVSVFFLSFLGVYLQIVFILLKNDIVHARLRVPAENSEQILPLKEMSHRANINLIDWCRLMLGLLFAGLNLTLLAVLASPIVSTLLNIFTWLGVVLLLVGVGFYGYQITLADRRIKEIAGQIVFQTADEEKGWEGGVFYHNADDAAFAVEKLSGGGYTFNMAHKRVYLYGALLAGLAIALISALTSI